MFLKGHIASIAIILLLGVAVVAFMFLAKERVEKNSKKSLEEKFSSYLFDILEKGIYDGCSNKSSSYLIESPTLLNLSFNNTLICIEGNCRNISYCDFEGKSIVLYRSTYKIDFSNKNNRVFVEVKPWQ